MEHLQASLESMLREYFHVVPVRTQRQDQWYKRRYQSWKRTHPDRDLHILCPKESKDEWTPKINRLAIDFASSLRDSAHADESGASFTPTDAKLFEDQILDDPGRLCSLGAGQQQALTPAMQRLSFWTSQLQVYHADLKLRACAIRELLERNQVRSLLYLVHQPDTKISMASDFRVRSDSVTYGWQPIGHDMLELLVLLVMLKCFPDSLRDNTGFESWIPFVFGSTDSVLRRYLTAPRRTKAKLTESQLQADINWCFEVLRMTDLLVTECNVTPINWERGFVDVFSSFLGFEVWNRMRAGERYLPCDLNNARYETGFHEASDKSMNSNILHPIGESVNDKIDMKIHNKDPLLLRGPKAEYSADLGDDDDDDDEDDEEAVKHKQKLTELEHLQLEETTYGLKRSMKYQRRKRSGSQ